LTAGSCSSRVVFNVPKAHSTGIEAELALHPAPGLEFLLSGNYQSAKFDSTVTTGAGDVLGGIEDGNRLPTVPKFQMAASATYGNRLSSSADWSITASGQYIGNRYGEPADQVPGAGLVSAIYYDPATGNNLAGVTPPLDFGSLRLPGYFIANMSAGVEWDNGFDVSLSNPADLRELVERTAPIRALTGVQLRIVRTNSKDLRLQKWADSFAAQLAACMHLLSAEYSVALMGSSEPYDGLVLPWGSNPVTDHLAEYATLINVGVWAAVIA